MRKYGVVAILLILFAVAAVAQSAKHDFETVQVAEGVYAFIASESNSGVVQGNVILIAGEESALLVDSGQFPSLAERMSAEIRKLTQKPVRVLVTTHWHGDHLLCNHIFRKNFPGLLVVAHEETARNAEKYYAKWEEQVAGFPKLIATIRERLQSGKKGDGTSLTEDQKKSYQIDADTLEAILPDARLTKYEAPEMTFQKEVTFDLGNRTVRVINFGWGNTAGDAVVFVPDTGVLVTGDTVVYPTPYSFGSYHGRWIEVLNRMIELGAKTYVPGHGPVMRDPSYIMTLISLFEDVRAQVQAAHKAGLSLAEVRKRVTLDDWSARLAGDNEDRRRAFREFFVDPGLEQAYKEAAGEPITE